MARIIDGIKELLGKGKDDDDDVPEYRHGRYDQPASNRIYGYPADGSADGRSGYRRPYGESLDDNYIRNGYDTRPSPRGGPEYRQPYGTEYASPRGTEYASTRAPGYVSPRGAEYAPNLAAGYVSPRGAEYARSAEYASTRGAEYASPRGSEYAPARAAGYVSPRGAEYARSAEYASTRGAEYPSTRGAEYASTRGAEYASTRGAEYASTRGAEYASTRGAEYLSPRGTEYRRPYVGSEVASPRGEYVRASLESPRDSGYQRGSSRRDDSSDTSVIEFMVPMCCDKCKEKVKEELSEVEGVESVRCDPPNSRVIVKGDDSIDVERCLKKAERAVKKKCELISTDARDSSARYSANRESYAESINRVPPSPSGRPTLGRQTSFASGKVTQYEGVGPRGQDYDARDYNGSGFRRMPSFGAHRNNEAEYITSYDRRPETQDSRREVYSNGVRRMPSFNKHRHHDAEYVMAGDREYSPRTNYESGDVYNTAYNERPVFRSQVSFSKLPVENPNYVKHIAR